VLAVAQSAHTIVLVGDPQQLDQPTQGSHPDGVDLSALNHILGEQQTISPDKGLFLEETWRLHPDICAFTSELFYAGKLRSKAGLDRLTINSSGPISGSLWVTAGTRIVRLKRWRLSAISFRRYWLTQLRGLTGMVGRGPSRWTTY
jgi:hypothetical protein